MSLPVTISGVSTAVACVGPFRCKHGVGIDVADGGNATSFGYDATHVKLGQTITVPSSGLSCNKITFVLAKSGAPTDNLTAKILDSLTGSVIATSNTVAGSSVTTSLTFITFTFSSDVALTAFATYAITIERSGAADASNYYYSGWVATDNLYSGGLGYIYNGSTWNVISNGHTYSYGFKVFGAPVYYFFGRDGTYATELVCHKTTDPSSSWPYHESATSLDTGIVALSGAQVSNNRIELLVMDGTMASAVAVKHIYFDTEADAFYSGIDTALLSANLTGQASAGWAVSHVVRSNGDVVAFYNSAQTKTSGTYRARVSYRIRSGSAWGTETRVDANTGIDNVVPEVILGVSDSVHFLWRTGVNTSSNNIYQRTMTSANALQTAAAVGTNNFGGPDCGIQGMSYDKGSGVIEVNAAALHSTGTGPSNIYFESGNTPTLQYSLLDQTSVQEYPIRLFHDPDNAVYGIYHSYTDGDLYMRKSTDYGATWGSATLIYYGITLGYTENTLSVDTNEVYQRGSEIVIPYLAVISGPTLVYNEYSLYHAPIFIQDTGGYSNIFGNGTYLHYAQDFTVPAGEAWTINEIDVYLFKTGNPGGFIVEIRDGSPNGSSDATIGTLLSDSPQTASSLVASAIGSFNRVTFSTPPTLNPGTYSIRLTTYGTANASNYFRVEYTSGSVYSGGSAYYYAGGSWTSETSDIRVKLRGSVEEQSNQNTLSAAGIASQPAGIGTPALIQTHALGATGIASAVAALGTPVITKLLTATSIASAAANLGTPALVQFSSLTATTIASAVAAIGTPAVTQKHGLGATGIASAVAALGTPAAVQTNILSATGIASAVASLGTPAITQKQVFTATSIASAAAGLGTPAIVQKHGLGATSLASLAASLGTPALAQPHVLSATSISSVVAGIGTPVITQKQVLAATTIASAVASIGTPTLQSVTIYQLTANSIACGLPALNVPNPTSYWPAEDSTSPGGGTIVGSVTYAAGEYGDGFQIPNSAGSYVSLSSSPIANTGSSWSIAAWISDANINNAPGGTSTHAVAWFSPSANNWIRFGSYAGGKITAEVNKGSGASGLDSTTAPVSNNTPIHIAATYNGTTLTLYAGGSSIAGSSATHSSGSAGTSLLGAVSSSMGWLYGWIDEVRVWDGTCLTSQEIADLEAWDGNPGNVNYFGTPTLTEMESVQHLSVSFVNTLLTDTDTHSQPGQSKPGYLQSYIDPVFGTRITRISDDPGNAVSGLSGQYWGDIVHAQYFKRKAWNADDSLLFVDTNTGGSGTGPIFLNGSTFVPAYSSSNRPTGEKLWHPTDPDKMLGTMSSSNEIVSYVVSTNTRTSVKTFTGYSNINFGPWKGSPTLDGHKIVVRGTRTSDSADVCFVYDLDQDIKGSDIVCTTWGTTPGHAEISPLGNYVLINYSEDDHIAVIDASNGSQLYSTSGGHPTHYDSMVINGIEYMVGRNVGAPNSGLITKTRISDGAVTALSTTGYARMTSTRNGELAIADMDTGTPYERSELVAFFPHHQNTNVYRIGYSRNYWADYEDDTQAIPSSKGDRVVFQSDWLNSPSGRPCQLYVVEIPRGLHVAVASFGTPVLAQANILAATSIASIVAAIGTPAITQTHVLTATSLASAAAGLDNAILSTAGALNADAIASAAASIGAPAITQTHVLGATSIASAVASIGAPVRGDIYNFTATSIASLTDGIGTPALTRVINFTATSLASAAAVLGTSAITQTHGLTATGIATANSYLGTPGITIGAVELNAPTIANSAPYLTATPAFSVVAKAKDLTATGIASANAQLDQPALGHIYNFTAATIASAQAAIGPAALVVRLNFAATDIAMVVAGIGSPTFTQTQVLSATSLASAVAGIGTATLGRVFVATSLASAVDVIGTPAITQKHVLTATSIASAQAVLDQAQLLLEGELGALSLATTTAGIGTPAITQKHVLGATSIASAQAGIGTPTLTRLYNLSATSLASVVDAIGTPAIGQKHVLTATTIASAAAGLGTPVLAMAGALVATDLASKVAAIGTPILTQRHVLAVTTLATAAASFDKPALTKVLTATSLASAVAAFTKPALVQFVAFTANSIASSAASIGTPAQVQTHKFTATTLAGAVAGIGTPALSQTRALTATSIATAQAAIGAPAISPIYNIHASDLVSDNATIDVPGIGQTHVLSALALVTQSAILVPPEYHLRHDFEALSWTSVSPSFGTPRLRTVIPGDYIPRVRAYLNGRKEQAILNGRAELPLALDGRGELQIDQGEIQMDRVALHGREQL